MIPAFSTNSTNVEISVKHRKCMYIFLEKQINLKFFLRIRIQLFNFKKGPIHCYCLKYR